MYFGPYIRVNSASLFNNYSLTGYQELANQANGLTRAKSGFLMKVIKPPKRENETNGFAYYTLLSGFPRYEVDVENAIKLGEIAVPDEFKPKLETANQTLSAADELSYLRPVPLITSLRYLQVNGNRIICFGVSMHIDS